jgi:hypothetical protein
LGVRLNDKPSLLFATTEAEQAGTEQRGGEERSAGRGLVLFHSLFFSFGLWVGTIELIVYPALPFSLLSAIEGI